MRSYRRSEHWIKLSRYEHRALLGVSVVALGFLIAFSFAERKCEQYEDKYIEQCHKSKQYEDSIDSLQNNLMRFGPNLNLKTTYNIKLPKNIDIRKLQKTGAFEVFVDGIREYFFGEVGPDKILLWLRNNTCDSLLCIYTSVKSTSLEGIPPKGDDSMIGGIAKNDNTFVLWPGRENNDTVNFNNNMAWSNINDCDFFVSKLIGENGRNDRIDLQEKGSDTIKKIYWLNYDRDKDRDKRQPDDDNIVLYGFSYDGRLAIELDFDPKQFSPEKRIFIQNKVFRNTVRKFSNCITSYLSSIDEWCKSSKQNE